MRERGYCKTFLIIAGVTFAAWVAIVVMSTMLINEVRDGQLKATFERIAEEPTP